MPAQDEDIKSRQDPSLEQKDQEDQAAAKQSNQRRLILFVLLALLGILLGFLIFSLAGRQKHVPPPPPKKQPAPKKAKVYDHCKDYDLDKEDAFGKFKVLVADFQELHESGDFECTAGAELTRDGFGYKIVDDEEEFVEDACAYDIIWIISAHEFDDDEDYQCYLRTIDQLFAMKKHFYIWADNSPYTVHANIFLERFFDGMRLSGNWKGQEIIQGTKSALTSGKFDQNHYIGCHLNEFYEGNTVCTAQNIHKDFKVFAYNSNFEPLILYAEQNDRHGRIVIDCGFTKLFKSYWDVSQTHIYSSNANLWLTAIPPK